MIRHSMCPWCMMSFPADEFLLQSLLEVIIPLSMFTLLTEVFNYDEARLILKCSLSLSHLAALILGSQFYNACIDINECIS